MNNNKTWQEICEIYTCTKRITLLAEEYDKEFNSFIQPINEIKNVLDHLVRSKSVELGSVKLKNATRQSKNIYIHNNLEKALAHAYRAFVDTSDYFAITFREKIINTLSPFNDEVISIAFPEYYSIHRTRIDEISEKVAEFRMKKDIGDSDNIMNLVREYCAISEELFEIFKKIQKKIAPLMKVKKGLTKKNILSHIIQGIIAFIIAFVFYLFGASSKK